MVPGGYASGLWSRGGGGTVWGDMVPGGMIPQGGYGPPCGETDTFTFPHLRLPAVTRNVPIPIPYLVNRTYFGYFIKDMYGMWDPGHCT